jgi:acyl carrier protein
MSLDGSMTADELTMARHLVQALNLEHVAAADIAPEGLLFGSQVGGLGLDSIDALEIALMVQQQYGVELRSDDKQAHAALASLRTLTAYVLSQRASLAPLQS